MWADLDVASRSEWLERIAGELDGVGDDSRSRSRPARGCRSR
ncbi:MAG: hypothetical protein R2713_06470 [Ilumatobacteraceae bacterium]